jgi:hypothetical protein
VCSITRASAEFLVISSEGFSCLADGRYGIGILALTHSVHYTFSAIYSTRLPKKNDGGVEMMTMTGDDDDERGVLDRSRSRSRDSRFRGWSISPVTTAFMN